MHLPDALISPAVGGAFWAASAATGAYSARKLERGGVYESGRVPMMGVAGAFIFAAQMVNIAIPGTGASGHIGGGLLLAALLGPHAGFLVICVVLALQALVFADGGLLALGCNIFNMGFLTCFAAYPLIFKPLTRNGLTKRSALAGSVVGAAFGAAAGAFSLSAQVFFSGVSSLPFAAFTALIVPIHIVIGAAEGFVTSAVLLFLRNELPAFSDEKTNERGGIFRRKKTIVFLASAALVCGGALSVAASSRPDGLEWSLLRTHGGESALEAMETDNYGVSAVGVSLSGLAGSGGALALALAAGLCVKYGGRLLGGKNGRGEAAVGYKGD